MRRIGLLLLLFLAGCSEPYLLYKGDIYQEGECIIKNATIQRPARRDLLKEEHIFFFDKDNRGHLLWAPDLEVRNASDTVEIRKRYLEK